VEPPDVRCAFAGSAWGIACKAAYGKPATIAKRIKDGVWQIDRAPVDHGFVAVQVTNIFPHEKMYEYDAAADVITSRRNLDAQNERLEELLQEATRPIEQAFWKNNRLRIAESSTRAVLFLAHTVSYFRRMRTIMGKVLFSPPAAAWSPEVEAFATEFGRTWQDLAWPPAKPCL